MEITDILMNQIVSFWKKVWLKKICAAIRNRCDSCGADVIGTHSAINVVTFKYIFVARFFYLQIKDGSGYSES